nr:MAG TPA: hypothetical protein [Bacteriophage sp.]
MDITKTNTTKNTVEPFHYLNLPHQRPVHNNRGSKGRGVGE